MHLLSSGCTVCRICVVCPDVVWIQTLTVFRIVLNRRRNRGARPHILKYLSLESRTFLLLHICSCLSKTSKSITAVLSYWLWRRTGSPRFVGVCCATAHLSVRWLLCPISQVLLEVPSAVCLWSTRDGVVSVSLNSATFPRDRFLRYRIHTNPGWLWMVTRAS